jgi:hypothetical protein
MPKHTINIRFIAMQVMRKLRLQHELVSPYYKRFTHVCSPFKKKYTPEVHRAGCCIQNAEAAF